MCVSVVCGRVVCVSVACVIVVCGSVVCKCCVLVLFLSVVRVCECCVSVLCECCVQVLCGWWEGGGGVPLSTPHHASFLLSLSRPCL